MTPVAIVMMVLFLLIVWGGLVVSIWYLRSHPTPYSDDDEDEELPQAQQVPRDDY